jgi:hypothetical protein
LLSVRRIFISLNYVLRLAPFQLSPLRPHFSSSSCKNGKDRQSYLNNYPIKFAPIFLHSAVSTEELYVSPISISILGLFNFCSKYGIISKINAGGAFGENCLHQVSPAPAFILSMNLVNLVFEAYSGPKFSQYLIRKWGML